jgi:hypothetical protein
MSATVRERELTVREATQRVHRAEETIHRWSWTGQLPAPKLGNGYQVTGEDLHAPAMLPLEVINALLTGVRQGRWEGQAADAASSFVASLPVSLYDNGRDRHQAWEPAHRYNNYPIYDILYVITRAQTVPSLPLFTRSL